MYAFANNIFVMIKYLYLVMKKIIGIACLLFLFTSCAKLLTRLYGVKKPRVESNETVINMLEKHGIEYDYLFRLNDMKAFNKVTQALAKTNAIIIADKNLNVLVTEDSSLCHMGVRSTCKELIRNPRLILKAKKSQNLQSVFDKHLICITCKEDFDFAKRDITVVLTYAKFLGFNEKISDIDFIKELQDEKLINKANVVLINMDFVDEN